LQKLVMKEASCRDDEWSEERIDQLRRRVQNAKKECIPVESTLRGT
jgi:hypothetical protein